MATFAPRDDGLVDVTLDNGTTVPMFLTPDQLQANGVMPRETAPPANLYADAGAAPALLPDERTAGGPGAPPKEPTAVAKAFAPKLTPQSATDAPRAGLMVPQGPVSPPIAPDMAPLQRAPGQLERPRPIGGGAATPGAPGAPGGAGDYTSDPLVQTVISQNLRGGRPVRVTPERDVRASFQVRPGKPLPDGHMDREREIAAQQDRGLIDASIAQEHGRLQEEQVAEKRILQEQDAIDAAKAHRARVNEELATAQKAVHDRMMDAENAKPIDENKFWKDKGAFAQLLGAISVGISEYARILSGGQRNVAKEMIDDAIERNIAGQKARYQQARDNAQEARNAYGDLIEVYGSPERAENELRLRLEALADKRMQLAAHKTGSAQIVANTEQQLAANRLEREQRWLQLAQSTQADVVENYQHQQARVVGGGGPNLGKALAAGAEATKNLRTIRGEDEKNLPPQVKEKQYGRTVIVNGQKFYTSDQSRAKEYQGVVDVYPQIQRNIDRLREIVNKGPQTVTPGDRAEVSALQQRLILNMKQLETLGAITKADQELVGPLTAQSANSLFSLDSSTQRTLDAASEHAKMRLNATERNLFYEPDLNTPLAAPPPPSVK